MGDERTEELLRGWMQSSVARAPNAVASASEILDRLDREPPAVGRQPRLRPLLQAAASLAVLAVVVGFLAFANGEPAPTPDDPRAVVEPGSLGPEATPVQPETQGPPIHWQSDEVDLHADSMSLRIGDETYVGRDAAFWTEAHRYDETSWWLSAAWEEEGQEHLLRFDFAADGEGWWIESVRHERPDIYGPDGARYQGLTWLSGSIIGDGSGERVALDRVATGDLRFEGTTRVPTCELLASKQLDVELKLSGLRLSVDPRSKSPLEELADSVFGPRSRIGRLVDPPPERQARFVELECPTPETISARLGQLELQAEPVGEGALRVLSDGINDLDQTIADVAVGPDGAAVVATLDGFTWLGSSAPSVETSQHVPLLSRVELAPDGGVLVTGGEKLEGRNIAAVWDGVRLTRLPAYALSSPHDVSAADIHDPTWDANSTLWVGAAGGVGSLEGDTWEHRSRYEYAPIAASYRAVSHGDTRSLAADPDGGLWVGTGHTFSHYRDGRWTEHDPLHDVVDSLVGPDGEGLVAQPLDLKIDEGGTMWALTRLTADGRSGGATILARRVGDAWSLYPLESVAPGLGLESQHLAVHDGAVFLLVVESTRQKDQPPAQPLVLRFDGTATQELAQLPAGLGYRLADVGPDGTVWIVGGSAERRRADRIHIVPPESSTVAESSTAAARVVAG